VSDPPADASHLPDAAELARRLAVVRARIEAARAAAPDRAAPEVRLLAVTKGFGPRVVALATSVGLVDLGESYAQELRAKVAATAEVAPPPRWHFIGNLQRNKVRQVAGAVHLWQSVDRRSLGEEIARRAPGAAVLVQVDLAGVAGRGGCRPDEVPDLVAALRDLGLEVRGLMGVAPRGTPEEARPGFRALVAQADRLGLAERSIGMTGDLEVAVEEGSTMVRVGRALFGPRPTPRRDP
jgi:uncharacterized pyridoxal phosphate-containing UPF0001 family protein